MDKRIYRDTVYLTVSCILSIIYLPHVLIYLTHGGGKIKSDVLVQRERMTIKPPVLLTLLFLLHTNSYFRSLFYFRIGPIKSALIKWYRPGNKYFSISQTTEIGSSLCILHPFGTIINADRIGKNLNIKNLTTLGAKNGKRPVIGDNVNIGVAVTIIGDVKIGNNSIIGAGSVVVKDVPANCIVAGNPARIIRHL